MPYKDDTQRREYDKEYKRKRRSQSWTKKGLDKRLTDVQVETAADLRDLLSARAWRLTGNISQALV